MKKTLWLIPVIGLAVFLGAKEPTTQALTETQVASIEKAVLQQHDQFLKYAQQLDVDKMYSLIAGGGKGTIIQNSKLLTRQEAFEASQKGFAGLKKIEYKFDQQHVNVISPEVAVFTGQGEVITITTSDNTYTSAFAVTSVFVLKDKEWKIIHGHYSSPSM